MKFFIKPTDPAKLEIDALIVFVWEKELMKLTGFEKVFLQTLFTAAGKEDFSGKEGQFLSISTKGEISAYKIILAGLGKQEEFNLYRLYDKAAKTIKKTQEAKPAKVAFIIPDFFLSEFTPPVVIRAMVEAISASSYRFLRYKNEEDKNKEREIEEVIFCLPAAKLASAEEGLKIGLINADATNFARDLINEPSAVTTPAYLAKVALDLAKSSAGLVKVSILEKESIQKLGMGAFFGVAKGSDEPPKFIRLQYRPTRPKRKVVLIGKGITFDTGGLSIKNAEAMETMKMDMAGAAAVIAIFSALPILHPPVEVVGIIPACENMPSGKALKPGDIVKAMNGKTIEVLNTDAEGRLTLADALSYAVLKEKPDEIIDLATLTGACMVALGQGIAGLWGNNHKLISSLLESSSYSAEKVWQMPLEKEYKDLLKSHIADIRNVSLVKYGGAITAALFLSEFAGFVPWVHLDIAGPAYEEKGTPLVPIGGAGFGVRLLLHYLSNISS